MLFDQLMTPAWREVTALSFLFSSSTVNNLCMSLRETDLIELCFGTSSSEKHNLVFFFPAVIGNLLLWFGMKAVSVASCDREIERNSELSASLPVKRRYILNKHIFFAVCTRRVRTFEVESKRGDKEK